MGNRDRVDKPANTAQQKKLKIGLVGENPDNDAGAVRNLLKRYYGSEADFCVIMRNTNASDLYAKSFPRRLKNVADGLDFVIIIHDLDTYHEDVGQVAKRKTAFDRCNDAIDERGIWMLNVTELEALILADIGLLRKRYNPALKPIPNTAATRDAKATLKSIADGKYKESDAPELFKVLDLKTVRGCNCHFDEFISTFENRTALQQQP